MSINNCNDNNNSSGDILKELKVSELKPHNNNNSYLFGIDREYSVYQIRCLDFETYVLF